MADEFKNVLKVAAAIKVVSDLDKSKKLAESQLIELKKQTALIEANIQRQRDKEEGEKIEREYQEVMRDQRERHEEEMRNNELMREIKELWTSECRENGLNDKYWKVVEVASKYLPKNEKGQVWELVREVAREHKLNFMFDKKLSLKDHLINLYIKDQRDELHNFLTLKNESILAVGEAIALVISKKSINFNDELSSRIELYLSKDIEKQKMDVAVELNGFSIPIVKNLHILKKAIEPLEEEFSKCFGVKALLSFMIFSCVSYFFLWVGKGNPEFLIAKLLMTIPGVLIPFLLAIGAIQDILRKKELVEEINSLNEQILAVRNDPFSEELHSSQKEDAINKIIALKNSRRRKEVNPDISDQEIYEIVKMSKKVA